MSDYSKLNIRFSNYGLNLTQDPQALEFGQYTKLNNVVSNIEGQITARAGMELMNDTDPGNVAIGDAIRGLRRLNDSIQGMSTYVVRAGTNLYVTVSTADGTVTTEPLFTFSDIIASSFNENFGSIFVHRTGMSNQVWAYIGDDSAAKKIAITDAGGIDIYNIGIVRPQANAPLLLGTGTGELTPEDTYVYRYTFYDSRTGVESLFNANENVDGVTLTNAQNAVSVQLLPETPDTFATGLRVYRHNTVIGTWLQVEDVDFPADYATNGYTFTDTLSDISIANADVLNEVSDRPFTTVLSNGAEQAGTPLPYWFGPAFGYVLATGDPNNPGILYWTDKFNPDEQDPSNYVEVTGPQDPLMNGLMYDGQPYVFSKEKLFRLAIQDEGWVPYELPCGRGLYFPHAFCVGPEIYFMGKDGIYATSGGPARLLSDDAIRPLFDGETVNGYSPIDFSATGFAVMAYHEHELWFKYRGEDLSVYCLIYDIAYRRWRFANFRTGTESLYSDEQTVSQLLMGSTDGYLFKMAGTADENATITTIPCELETQTMTLNSPLIHKEFGHLILDMNPNGTTVLIVVYSDNKSTVVTTDGDASSTRTRKFIALNTFAENLTINISWASSDTPPILYGYELLYRPDAVKLEQWSVTGVSHGIEGWQILRSGYVTLRSDGTTFLTVTADGNATTYTIPSTGGYKRKLFIPFNPTKGKVFDYRIILDTATYFRLYNEMCEVHVKPWVTSLGYGRSNPFEGGEATQLRASRPVQGGQSSDAGLPQVPSQGFVPSVPIGG